MAGRALLLRALLSCVSSRAGRAVNFFDGMASLECVNTVLFNGPIEVRSVGSGSRVRLYFLLLMGDC